MAHDPRLQDGLNRTRLIQIVSTARPNVTDAMLIASRVPVDQARIIPTHAYNAWESVIVEADAAGHFDQLLRILIQDLGDNMAARELSAWARHVPLADLNRAVNDIRNLLEAVTSVQNLATVDFELRRLCQTLASMTRALADPEAPERAFGGLGDSVQQARRARDAARQASASADSLLYQVDNVGDFLNREPAGLNPRDLTDHFTAQGLLVQHLLSQRAELDRAVTSLLDVLHAIWPAYFVHSETRA